MARFSSAVASPRRRKAGGRLVYWLPGAYDDIDYANFSSATDAGPAAGATSDSSGDVDGDGHGDGHGDGDSDDNDDDCSECLSESDAESDAAAERGSHIASPSEHGTPSWRACRRMESTSPSRCVASYARS